MCWLLLGCLFSAEEYQELVLVAQDADGDGQAAAEYGGQDCDDSDPSVSGRSGLLRWL